MRKGMQKVEVYFDPSGFRGGRFGCFKARLASNPGICDSGPTVIETQAMFLKTARSFGMSGDAEDYRFTDPGRRCDFPGGIAEVDDLVVNLRGRVFS